MIDDPKKTKPLTYSNTAEAAYTFAELIMSTSPGCTASHTQISSMSLAAGEQSRRQIAGSQIYAHKKGR